MEIYQRPLSPFQCWKCVIIVYNLNLRYVTDGIVAEMANMYMDDM